MKQTTAGQKQEREPPPRVSVPSHLQAPPAAQPWQRPLCFPTPPVGAENPCPLRDLGIFVEQLGVQANDRTAVASAYAARRVGVEEPTNRLAVAFAELALVV